MRLDHDRLRERTLEEIKKVRWSPEWGEDRISNMIATRPDWCISRQRAWGVPIIVFHCVDCNKPLLDTALARKAVELFKKESADAWYTHDVKDLVPEGTKCPDCGGSNLRKETDILDVWFDSGSSHAAVLGHRPDLPWPADVYLEGGDQHRGWFNSSLLVGMVTRGAPPYRAVLTHGWALDAQGRAMSKSLGNVIDPNEVIKTHGAEILRLWVASIDFREDVAISADILARLSEAYRKLRNTFRYCLSNLYDFDPAANSVRGDQLEEIDCWAHVATADLLERVYAAYNEDAFHKVYRAIYDFATIELSSFYFDILKDRLYTAPAHSVRRRAAQTTLYRIADALVRAVAPLMSFTADEVWSHLPKSESREPSVHLAQFVPASTLHDEVPAAYRRNLDNWPRLIEVRDAALKALETARRDDVIHSPLEARVYLSGDEKLAPLLEKYRADLPTLLIVSQVELEPYSAEGAVESSLSGLKIRIERASGGKCARCWNYSEQVGQDEIYPDVCERCLAALHEIEAGAAD